MTQGNPRGPYAKGVERRQEILDRAFDVLARNGYSKTTLRLIAKEIGISHGTILHYFASLEDLLLAVLQQRDQIAPNASAHVEQTLVGELRSGAAYNVQNQGFVGLYSRMLLAALEPHNEQTRAYFRARFSKGREVMGASIDEGRRRGVTPEGIDAQNLAALLMAASDGLQIQSHLEPDLDLPEIYSALFPMIGGAPAAWEGSPRTPFDDV